MRIPIQTRRQSEIISFYHDGISFIGQVSYGPNWRPLEVFLDGGKSGTAVQNVARDSAVAVSLALQYGTPLETLRLAMTRSDDGSAAGPLGRLLDLVTAA